MHRFDVKTITITQNYESDQIIMHCINLTSKRSKKLSYVPKLQKWSHYNELHRFDVKTIKNVEVRRKTFKTTQNYKRNQITMNFIDLTSIWRQNDHKFATQNYESDQIIMHCINLTSKRSKKLSYVAKHSNYKSDHITMNCIDLMSKQSKMLRYVAKHSKQRKTTKEIKLQWISSIWRQNDHNNAKLRKWSNYNALHQFDVKTI